MVIFILGRDEFGRLRELPVSTAVPFSDGRLIVAEGGRDMVNIPTSKKSLAALDTARLVWLASAGKLSAIKRSLSGNRLVII